MTVDNSCPDDAVAAPDRGDAESVGITSQWAERLTDRQYRYVLLRAQGVRPCPAARRAGYSNLSGAASVRAVELERHPHVRAAVERMRAVLTVFGTNL